MDPEDRLQWMDSGLAVFRLKGGPAAALNHVMTEMGREGGRVTRSDDGTLLLDNSDAWRRRYISAKLEESDVEGLTEDERAYAVQFREANGNTRLRTLALTILAIVLLFAAGFLPWRWCRIACAIAVIIACLFLLLSPDDGCRRRNERIIQSLNQPHDHQENSL